MDAVLSWYKLRGFCYLHTYLTSVKSSSVCIVWSWILSAELLLLLWFALEISAYTHTYAIDNCIVTRKWFEIQLVHESRHLNFRYNHKEWNCCLNIYFVKDACFGSVLPIRFRNWALILKHTQMNTQCYESIQMFIIIHQFMDKNLFEHSLLYFISFFRILNAHHSKIHSHHTHTQLKQFYFQHLLKPNRLLGL